jgi:diguanylate cyclase (GGDEF)-like protein
MSAPTLHAFLVANREEILERSRSKLGGRAVPAPTGSKFADGLPLFLDQLVTVLSAQKGDLAAEHASVAASATIHGGQLLRRGLTVGQVVHDYGSICQSVTEVASERHAAITAEEFQMFNQCLDDAIAQAVTAYEHERDPTISGSNVTQLGVLAHEMRNLLSTSILTFDAICKGSVGVNGTTGAMLGRSLRGMRSLIDHTLAEVRLEAEIQTSERVVVVDLIEEIEIIATLEAKNHNVEVVTEPGAADVAVEGDRQVLVAAIANLVQNACKFTRQGGRVSVSTRLTGERVLIDVQDQCGGLPPGTAEELFLPFERRGVNQRGLGLGLSISLKAVRASGGEIHVRDMPGRGCVFTIDLPRARRTSTNGSPPDAPIARFTPPSPEPAVEVATASNLPSVLVVDDDEDIREALRDLLSNAYRITVARDGVEALTALRDAPFDLAIVDLNLPIVDGVTVVTTIRARSDHPSPAILFLSGQSDSQKKSQALALGDVDYMSKPFDSDELVARIARILAAVALEANLRAETMCDSLTGLANHKYFTQNLDRELERSRRYELPLSLITLDLDHMRVINDRHGHEAGDDAIRLVANLLTTTVRRFELVARHGADEFVIILPNTPASDARKLAARLHEAVGVQAFLDFKLSASIGVVSWDNHGGGEERYVQAAALLDACDEALDRAKLGGGDRIESHQM